jgi:hypothetical protein
VKKRKKYRRGGKKENKKHDEMKEKNVKNMKRKDD